MKNKKSSKKSLIKLIIIDIFLILCVAILFYEFYQSKKAEQTLAQIQTQQEENRKQRELERQAEQKKQEELAKQEQARLEEIQKSLPTKFDMRNKIKINVEDQRNKPFCTYYTEIKAREIALNYQGNYNYNFKKVYKYLQTVPDEEYGNWRNTSKFLKESIGFEDNYATNCNLGTIELKNALVNGKPLPMIIDRELSTNFGANTSSNAVGHTLVVIGYNDTKQSWLCLNSWGANWGNNGTCWIEYDNEHILQIGALEEITE